MKKRIVAYKRVSSEAQVEGTSLEEQEKRIRAWVKLYKADHELSKIYSDEGKSGGSLDRPALQQLLQDAKDGQFEAMIFTKLDRLARSMKDLLKIWEDLEKAAININCVDLNVDTTKPEGKLMRNVLGAFAEFERDVIRERCDSGLMANWRKGLVIGELPLGYCKDANGRAAVDPEGAKLYKRIVDLYLNEHLTMRELANRLDEEGFPTPSQRKNKKLKSPHWNSIYISKTLRNPAYTGTATRLLKRKKEERIDAFYPQLISKAKWEKIQRRILQQTHKSKRSWKGYEDKFWLDGFLYCGLCGGKVRKRVQVRNGKSLLRYICHWRHCGPRICKQQHRDYCTMRQVDSGAADREVFQQAARILASPGQYIDAWLKELGASDLDKRIKGLEYEKRKLQTELEKGFGYIRKAATPALLEFYEGEQAKTESALQDTSDRLVKLREEQEIIRTKGTRFREFKTALKERGGYMAAKRSMFDTLYALPDKDKRKLIEAMISPWDGGRVILRPAREEDSYGFGDELPDFVAESDFRIDLDKIERVIAALDRSGLGKGLPPAKTRRACTRRGPRRGR